MRVFVYGTLMPGFGNHSVIEGLYSNITPATIQGVMFDVVGGGFPGVVRGYHTVKGMLVTIKKGKEQQALQAMDALEGHPLMYRRTKVFAVVKGRNYPAWTYIWQGSIDRCPHVKSGDWYQYKGG